jgi:hypothetical protein
MTEEVTYEGPSWFGLGPICNAPEGTITELPCVGGGEPLRLEILQRGGHFENGQTIYVFCVDANGDRVRLEAVCSRSPSEPMTYKMSA